MSPPEAIVWKEGTRFKCAPEVAARAVSAAQGAHQDSTCQAQELVDLARDEDSPLHDDFEWDDAVAAELHRCETARAMIRGLAVIVEDGTVEPLFCHIRVGDTSGYMPTRLAIKREDTRECLLEQACRDARAFQNKYAQLEEMASVVRAIAGALDAA